MRFNAYLSLIPQFDSNILDYMALFSRHPAISPVTQPEKMGRPARLLMR